eukprot:1804611-Amphidinium_carterae.1
MRHAVKCSARSCPVKKMVSIGQEVGSGFHNVRLGYTASSWDHELHSLGFEENAPEDGAAAAAATVGKAMACDREIPLGRVLRKATHKY